MSSAVRFLFDRSQSASYDFDQTAPTQSISGTGGTRLYTFTYTPTVASQYSYVLSVRTTLNGNPTLTDSWLWVATVRVQ